MDSITIQGNIYDLQFIKTLMKDGTDDERALDIFKQFQRDIYKTYTQIRHIHKPKACEKTTLETVKKSLREHWLEHYLNMNLTEAHIVIEYAELFFGLAIK